MLCCHHHSSRSWANMERAEVKKFVRDDGVLDEFALMNSKKKELPLHYMLFRSHAAHLGQELPSSVTGGLPCQGQASPGQGNQGNRQKHGEEVGGIRVREARSISGNNAYHRS